MCMQPRDSRRSPLAVLELLLPGTLGHCYPDFGFGPLKIESDSARRVLIEDSYTRQGCCSCRPARFVEMPIAVLGGIACTAVEIESLAGSAGIEYYKDC